MLQLKMGKSNKIAQINEEDSSQEEDSFSFNQKEQMDDKEEK